MRKQSQFPHGQNERLDDTEEPLQSYCTIICTKTITASKQNLKTISRVYEGKAKQVTSHPILQIKKLKQKNVNEEKHTYIQKLARHWKRQVNNSHILII